MITLIMMGSPLFGVQLLAIPWKNTTIWSPILGVNFYVDKNKKKNVDRNLSDDETTKFERSAFIFILFLIYVYFSITFLSVRLF